MNHLAAAAPALDAGNTAWVLVSASLVLLMTPALALFYGGMNRSTSVLNMMMMSFGAMGVVGVLFVLWGYSMAFGTGGLGGLVADPLSHLGLRGVITEAAGEYLIGTTGVPTVVFAGFQLTFAVLTVALISGAVSDRVRFGTWLAFAALWSTLVYFPLAHMVWGGGVLSSTGWFSGGSGESAYGPIDVAGGTVVHINAGMAALVLAVVTGRRVGFGSVPMRPHNVPLTMLGAGLLWFGWFGFNAGSALAADGAAGLAWVDTAAATCAALLGWLAVERLRHGHATSVGAASGVVAGLVAVTPGCSVLTPVGALVIGAVAGALAAVAVDLKSRLGYDDSLDVVGVHLVAGVWGTVAIGLLARDTGLLYGHGWRQLWVQTAVAVAALAFTGVLTTLIALALRATLGWRIDADDEVTGIDAVVHAESAYELGPLGSAGRISRHRLRTRPVTAPADRPSQEEVPA